MVSFDAFFVFGAINNLFIYENMRQKIFKFSNAQLVADLLKSTF